MTLLFRRENAVLRYFFYVSAVSKTDIAQSASFGLYRNVNPSCLVKWRNCHL